MPQFYMIDSDSRDFASLDAFTRGYIEALFFTDNAPGVTTEEWQATEDHDEGSIPGDVGFSDLAPETLAEIILDCTEFQKHLAIAEAIARPGYSLERAGHDFWLTRNHHGAGFWDRKELEADDLGDTLTDLAHECGEVSSYLGDDGKVYLM